MGKSLLKIFYAPVEVFNELKEKPYWLLAFIVFLVVMLASSAGLLPIIKSTAMETMQGNIPSGDAEQAMGFFNGPKFYLISLVGVCFSTILGVLFQAGIFLFILSLFFRKDVTFKQMLSLTVHTKLVTLLGIVIKFPIILAKQSMEVHTDLLLFAPFLKPKTFLYTFLGSMDFFTIWSFVLFAMGISVFTKLEQKKTYILVFVSWLISIVILSLISGFGK
ncbi:MAG: YIP1 family protein [bacterium]|nr:YIP1 family protein [bacterium]